LPAGCVHGLDGLFRGLLRGEARPFVVAVVERMPRVSQVRIGDASIASNRYRAPSQVP
jgi:hypothetical protein